MRLTEDDDMDAIQLHPDIPGDWGPFHTTGADTWRADSELAGQRRFIKIFGACGPVATDRTVSPVRSTGPVSQQCL
jgi:hypothetical protein